LIKLFALIIALSFNASLAQAQISDNEVRQFIAKHQQIIKICNPAQVIQHLNTNFTPNYAMTIAFEGGEKEQITRQNFITEINLLSQFSEEARTLEPSDCMPTFQFYKIAKSGADTNFISVERETDVYKQDGKNYQATYTLACRNTMVKQQNPLMMTQSICQDKEDVQAR